MARLGTATAATPDLGHPLLAHTLRHAKCSHTLYIRSLYANTIAFTFIKLGHISIRSYSINHFFNLPARSHDSASRKSHLLGISLTE